MNAPPELPASARWVAIALGAAMLVTSATALARSSDRSKPMELEADRTDYSLDESRPTVMSGRVVIQQGTLDIRAARAEITQRNGEPVRAVLTGTPVTLKQQLDDGTPMSASARNVDYNLKTEVVVFTGDVRIQQARGSLSGQRVTYHMASGQVQSGGEGGGRVRMRILPRGAGTEPSPAASSEDADAGR